MNKLILFNREKIRRILKIMEQPSIKIVKIYFFAKYCIFHLRGVRIGSYSEPKGPVRKIGYFDMGRLAHVEKEFQKYFDTRNLYNSGKYEKLKCGISLVFSGNKVMIKKEYKGLAKIFTFYNEINCLHRLRKLSNIPKIYYIDYSSMTVFISYIDGICLVRMEQFPEKEFPKDFWKQAELDFKNLLKKMHQYNIVQRDVKAANAVMLNADCYFIDFEGGIDIQKLPIFYQNYLKHDDEKKLEYRLLKKIRMRSQ